MIKFKPALIIILIALITFNIQYLSAQITEKIYLSGKGSDDAVEWDFYCTKGRKSGIWSTIPVPSHWELHGYGVYHYGHAYSGDEEFNDEQGIYRKSFTIPSSWSDKKIRIVFDGSMTDTKVLVNGKSPGPIHQGSFYRFKYDITNIN